MSSCCPATPPMQPPVLSAKKWAVMTGAVFANTRCPCSSSTNVDGETCLIELQPKPDWDGWSGTLETESFSGGTVNVQLDINCGVSNYVASVSTDQGCGSASTNLSGTCDSVNGTVNWVPSGCDCCNCFPGQAPGMSLVISNNVPSQPPLVAPAPVLPDCGDAQGQPGSWANGNMGTTQPGNAGGWNPQGTPPGPFGDGNPGNTGSCSISSGPPVPPVASNGPVRYGTGELILSQNDFRADGYGLPWGQTRRFSNRLSVSRDAGNGFNWFIDQLPYLERAEVNTKKIVFVMGGVARPLPFNETAGTSYSSVFAGSESLSVSSVTNRFTLRGKDGSRTEFDSVSGLFKRFVAVSGQTIEVTQLTATDTKIAQIEQSYNVSGETATDRYTYAYTQPYDQRLESVTLSRSINGGAFVDIQRAKYTYYGLRDPNGLLGDLKTATTESWQNSTWVSTDVSYYRYWKDSSGGSSSSSSAGGGGGGGGGKHLIKYALNPAGYERMVAAGFTPETSSDATLAQFADYYFEYDSQRRVTKETILSGSQTYLFSYTTSAFPDDLNKWKTKTVETLPDGNQNIVYSNHAAQTMLHVFKSGGSEWINFYKYNSAGKVVLHANPSAVTGYDETKADLLNLNAGTGKYQYLRDDSGLIYTYDYHACAGYVTRVSLQKGQLGTPIKRSEYSYVCCGANCGCTSSSSSSSSSSSGSGSVANQSVWYLSEQIDYPSDVDQSKKTGLSYVFTYHTGTCTIKQRTTTFPVVSTAQNGSGTATTRRDYFDLFGNQTWAMDERGFLTRFTYDIPTGALTQQVDDADASLYSDVPAGWTAPSGGGLNLVTDYLFDNRGRTTQSLAPSHSIDLNGTATTIRTASWVVYDDPNHTVYTGQGYATGSSPSYTYSLVNPVGVVKMNAAGRVNERITATTGTTSNSLPAIITAAGSGSAAFPQASYVRWTTIQYTDCCLVASQRVYHLIPASGTGSSGTNYDESDFGYDLMKRLNREVTPGGTITDLVYDARGFLLATYTGTDDTGATLTNPAAGGPPNNMVLVTSNEYDNGAAGGDGNLTKVTQHVDASTTRVTNMTYDFRDRLVTVDGEIDFFSVT